MSPDGFIDIAPHTLHKYNILKKYLSVCKTFDTHYSNFVYIDTHGGSGKVFIKGREIDGSPLIAAHWTPSFPCYIIEIDPKTYQCLGKSAEGCSNIHTYNGDCNKLVTSILFKIPRWKKFVFCFVDPNSLVYRGANGTVCDQLCADTITTIAGFPRSELLLNFPLESILRCAGDYCNNPTEPRAIASGERVTTFMGSTSWQDIEFSDARKEKTRKAFLELYMDEMLDQYPYKGAILIRSEAKNLPLYYLVYTTHNETAAKIMRDIMKKEGNFSLYRDLLTGKPQTMDEIYPLERFIFEH